MARVIMPTRCPQAVEKISRGLRSSVARSGKRRDPQWLYRIEHRCSDQLRWPSKA